MLTFQQFLASLLFLAILLLLAPLLLHASLPLLVFRLLLASMPLLEPLLWHGSLVDPCKIAFVVTGIYTFAGQFKNRPLVIVYGSGREGIEGGGGKKVIMWKEGMRRENRGRERGRRETDGGGGIE